MNLNDPFNRHSKQQNREYAAFCTSIKESIHSEQDALNLLNNMNQRFNVFLMIIIGTAALIILFIPNIMYIVIAFSAVIILWLWTSILKGKRFIRRYIQEYFSNISEV